MAKHNETGRIGEDIAANYLKDHGFQIIDRNYRKPYGEIDIVAHGTGPKGQGRVHFIEVKTVSYEALSVSKGETYRPEDNVHPQKLLRLARVIQTYLISHGTVGDWQFDVLCVYLDQVGKRARVKVIPDIVIGT